ncbi:protein TIC 22, chloroplastic-like isoform X3 [Pyrus communis]|uniref:protein TIC 22, chloroplastic-like isoform X3 n=1 Tax=Pyrus communis TaxID=23211 RepID=UPI0035C23693
MESAKTYPRSNPLLSLSTFIHQHCLRLGAELSTRFEDTKRLAGILAGNCAPLASRRMCSAPVAPPFAWLAQSNHALAATLSSDHVAKSLAGTAVYTVRSRRELRSAAKVVPITLDQVYMLKVEGIAFRFLPDPVQIRNALELKSSDRSAFDGVPVFQSDLLVMKKKNKRYCPIYFTREDIEKELSKVSRASRGPGVSQHIMVGSLEDVLRKMESSEKNSGWEDLIFIPPGKSYSQHIQDVVKA